MPNPSAMAVCVSPLALRMRRMRGPAKIFCSAMAGDQSRRDSAPLCPAGHLPLMGRDWLTAWLSPLETAANAAQRLPISPLVGEMSGRTEGGNVEHHHDKF